jgi:hypothetical protein
MSWQRGVGKMPRASPRHPSPRSHGANSCQCVSPLLRPSQSALFGACQPSQRFVVCGQSKPITCSNKDTYRQKRWGADGLQCRLDCARPSTFRKSERFPRDAFREPRDLQGRIRNLGHILRWTNCSHSRPPSVPELRFVFNRFLVVRVAPKPSVTLIWIGGVTNPRSLTGEVATVSRHENAKAAGGRRRDLPGAKSKTFRGLPTRQTSTSISI